MKLGFLELLAIILIVLNSMSVIDISWFWILLLLLPMVFKYIILGLFLIAATYVLNNKNTIITVTKKIKEDKK